jgi:CVNH domain
MRYRFVIGLLLMLPILALGAGAPAYAGGDQFRYGGPAGQTYRYGDDGRDWDDNGYGYGGYGQLPGGDWRSSCRNIVVRGDKLFADCRDANGRSQHTGITYAGCGAVVVARSGELQCARRDLGYGGLPDGSFRSSCRNEHVENGYLLVARCADWNGNYRNSTLDLRACGRSDIQNRGGSLVCRNGSGGAWWSHNG